MDVWCGAGFRKPIERSHGRERRSINGPMLHGRYVCQRKNHSGELFFVDRGFGMDGHGIIPGRLQHYLPVSLLPTEILDLFSQN